MRVSYVVVLRAPRGERTLSLSLPRHAIGEKPCRVKTDSFGADITKFKWLWRKATAPAIAMTFESSADRDQAMGIVQGWELDEASSGFRVKQYQRAHAQNTIWSMEHDGRANLHELKSLLLYWLPSLSYNPCYRLV